VRSASKGFICCGFMDIGWVVFCAIVYGLFDGHIFA